MSGEARIRVAREGDLPQLRDLDPWPSESVWRHKISAGEVLVVALAGRLVGVAHYALLWSTVPFLGLIRLRPEVRGRGLSRRLLAVLAEHLRSQGFTTLLSSSQTDEPTPQAWHRHLGFREVGLIEDIADDGVGEVVFRIDLERR